MVAENKTTINHRDANFPVCGTLPGLIEIEGAKLELVKK
jgi:hypothetical protein